MAKPDITQAYKVLQQLALAWDAPETSTITIIDPQAEGGQREVTVADWLAAVEPAVSGMITAAENFVPRSIH
jgi:hypothetical protein